MAAGEDITTDEIVPRAVRFVAGLGHRDALEARDATRRFEEGIHSTEVGFQKLRPDRFEHFDGDNLVEFFAVGGNWKATIVAQEDVDFVLETSRFDALVS